MEQKHSVGGQAVIEGVMMRGIKGVATAVRKEDGTVSLDIKEKLPAAKKNKFFALPIVRGFVSLIESTIVGIETLNYSASLFEDETEEPSKFENFLNKVFKNNANKVILAFSLCFSFIFAIGIFFILPTFAANLASKSIKSNSIILNLIEGIIRVAIFIIYLFLVGKLEDVNRVFEYHGAEHKAVFCYEKGEELTPYNAAKCSRFHPRCGTNFLFLVMIVSILLFSLTGWNSLLIRIISRIVMLPLVSGVTYEIIKWLGKSDNAISKIISYPGLMLQRLTTREPDESQLEVAITALKAAEGIEI
jgi:uncharacterized protein YqhQ